MKKLTVRDIDVKNKLVLVRVDYNVPIKDGVVGDTLRLTASFDTINYLLSQNARVVLMSHLGRPDGKVDAKYTLEPVAQKAGELLGKPVKFVSECVGQEVKKAVEALEGGQVLLLENLRFHAEEEANDADFAKQLAEWGEVYVDDAFAAVHRAHASTVGVTKYLPSVAGLLVEREVDTILGALETPDRPLVAIVGGAKVSTKLEVLNNLIPKVDVLMLGGAMANTFYLADGVEIGKSQAEPDLVSTAKELLKLAITENTEVFLPETVVVSESLEAAKNVRTVSKSKVGKNDYIVDAAPDFAEKLTSSVEEFLDFDNRATVIWNGPLGITEIPETAGGSRALAEAILKLRATSVIGGGDTAAFVDESGLHDKFSWVSTGGGASLELMSGKKLPGVEALKDK